MSYTHILASSLANNLKLVGSPDTCTGDSSSTPSSPSKSPRRRKSSNGLVELINKFGGHSKLKRPPSQVQLNDEVKEQLASKSPSQSPKRGRLSKLWPPPQTQWLFVSCMLLPLRWSVVVAYFFSCHHHHHYCYCYWDDFLNHHNFFSNQFHFLWIYYSLHVAIHVLRSYNVLHTQCGRMLSSCFCHLLWFLLLKDLVQHSKSLAAATTA